MRNSARGKLQVVAFDSNAWEFFRVTVLKVATLCDVPTFLP